MLEEPCNRLIEDAIDSGRIPIGYTCSYVPHVLLSIPPLLPVRVRAPGARGTELADIYMSNLTCSYTRSILEFAMDYRYDFLAGWVHTAGCDHLRRLNDNLEYLLAPQFSHIMDVPHRTTAEGVKWYKEEIEILAEKLETGFDVKISEKALASIIEKHNAFAGLLDSVARLRKEDPPPLSGTEFHKIMAASMVSPAELIAPQIEKLRDSLAAKNKKEPSGARLMIVGGHLDDPQYIETIESTGAVVVADRMCTGSINGIKPIRQDKAPIDALAEHFLRTPSCPRMMEDFDKRVEQIVKAAKEYRVEGIIVQFIKFCDTWGVESASLGRALRDAGFKVLTLEREYGATGMGQLQTRVQAFLESMEGQPR